MFETPLFTLDRDGVPEVRGHGECVVVWGDNEVWYASERRGSYPARSLLKPYQFLAMELPEEKWLNTGEEDRYLACCGSISATEEQAQRIREWYTPAELNRLQPLLKLRPAFPMDDRHRVDLQVNRMPPEFLYNVCFSKHAAILESCMAHGWRLESYADEAHPYQLKVMDLVAKWGGAPVTQTVVDGCQLPSPVLPLKSLAKLYQHLAEGADVRFATLRDRMMTFPGWIGGPGRVETDLMLLNSGKVISKTGADGLLALGVRPSAKYPRGLGIAIKLDAGFVPQQFGIVLAPILESLGLRGVFNGVQGQTARWHFRPFEALNRNLVDASPLVSSKLAVWPEDVAYTRKISRDVNQGDNYGLSSLNTTVHLGTHTDAPNHFSAGGVGIDGVNLEKYLGTSQVIEVKLARGAVIEPKDIHVPISAPRVLFKTSSFPDPSAFNTDFVSLSPKTIAHLAAAKVELVGIDTPSIDPFSSKDLLAHHATVEYQMAILEGLVLEGAGPGLYDMVALPLKLEGADASPVRVALIPVG